MLFTLLALAFDVAVRAGLVVVVVASVAGFRRVVEQHAARPVAHRLDQVDGEVGVVLEALPVRFHVPVAVGIHDLARRDARHQPSERRALRALAVDVIDLIRVGHQLGFVQPFAVLIHGHVLQLRHIEAVAEQVQLVAADGIVVLLVRVRHVGHVVELALVEPFHQQLEACRLVVRKVEPVLLLLAIALQFRLQHLGMVAEQVAVQRPVAPGLADVDVDHAAGEESVALQLSFCSHMETMGIEAMRQAGPHGEASRSHSGRMKMRLIGRIRILRCMRLGI